jgi:hypothetical protein
MVCDYHRRQMGKQESRYANCPVLEKGLAVSLSILASDNSAL